jgi:hypothetical protein
MEKRKKNLLPLPGIEPGRSSPSLKFCEELTNNLDAGDGVPRSQEQLSTADVNMADMIRMVWKHEKRNAERNRNK